LASRLARKLADARSSRLASTLIVTAR
jgi:hypothetical protein